MSEAELSGLSDKDAELFTAKMDEMHRTLMEEQRELESQELDIYQPHFDEQRARQQELVRQTEAQLPRTRSTKARNMLSALSSPLSSIASTIATNARSTVAAAASLRSPANARKGAE